MTTLNFRPAGFESSDEDDFLFGDDYVEKKKPYGENNSNSISTSNSLAAKGRGGFGVVRDQSLPSKSAHSTIRPGFKSTLNRDKPSVTTRPVQKRAQGPQNGLPKSQLAKGHGDPAWLQSENIPLDDYRMAVMRNNTHAVKEFLDQGVMVDTVFSTRWTALMYAVQNAHPQMVQLLLERGADVNFNKDMFTVLMAACSSTCEAESDILTCVSLLLDKDTDVNAYDRYHMTGVIYATRKQRATVIKKLAEAGANLDKQDNKGYTALMYAASQGHVRCVQVLLEAGADYNKQSCDGSRAADMASLQGHQQAEVLIRSKEDPNKSGPVLSLDPEPAGDAHKQPLSVSMDSMLAGSNHNIHKYGDLELFLSGIDLSHLIPTFQQNQVRFEDLLRMNDQNLQQLGVHQMGVRKKILDAVHDTHKKAWETSSINPVQYNKKISCAEAVAMVTNIKRHACYISSSIGYITDQIKASPDILVNTQDGSGSEELGIQSEEAITNVKFLYEELLLLRNHLTEVAHRPEYSPPDLIRPMAPHSGMSSAWSPRVLLAGFAICAVLYYKQETVREGIVSLVDKYFPVLRKPFT